MPRSAQPPSTPAQPQLLQAAAWLRSGFMLRNSFALEVPRSCEAPSPLSGGIEGVWGAPLLRLASPGAQPRRLPLAAPADAARPATLRLFSSLRSLERLRLFLEVSFLHLEVSFSPWKSFYPPSHLSKLQPLPQLSPPLAASPLSCSRQARYSLSRPSAHFSYLETRSGSISLILSRSRLRP
jgi:hypothetical protein